MSLFDPKVIRKKLKPFPVLETERLILRKIGMEDVQDMYEYSRDPETCRYLLWESHQSPDVTRKHIQNLEREYRALHFFDWALVEKQSGKMIGTAGFTRIFDRNKVGEIGYVIAPSRQRQGIAPEAIARLLSFGFGKLELSRIDCRIMEHNLASRKVAQRLGFQFRFFERERVLKRGKKERIARYSLTKEQYDEKTC